MKPLTGLDFVSVLAFALQGYGMRRSVWASRDNCYLLVNRVAVGRYQFDWAEGNAVDRPAALCPDKPDLAIDLLPEDLNATDWETV